MLSQEELLRRILAVIGAGTAPALGALACGGSVEDTGHTGAGAATSPGGAAGAVLTGTGGTTASDTGGGVGFLPNGGNCGEGGSFVPGTGGVASTGGSTGSTGFVPITFPIPCSCTLEGTAEYLEAPPAECGAIPPDAYEFQRICLDPPFDVTCEAGYDRSCVAGLYGCGLSGAADYVCGPLPSGGPSCCYVLAGGCAVGRPFLVSGVARRAAVAPGTGWAVAVVTPVSPPAGRRPQTRPVSPPAGRRPQSRPDVSDLDPVTRRALADAWAENGATEHASVAAFARFTLQCLSVGAPAELVRAAQQAGLDEVAHARAAFAFASAYARRELRPGRLDVTGSLEGELDPISIARSVASEACVAETVSAVLVAAARDAATDAAVRDALERIATEENEHALLGWRYLRWALDGASPELRATVAEVFDHAEEYVGLGVVTAVAGCASAMRKHGYLPVEERRALATRALREVVAPAARALLGATRDSGVSASLTS